MENLSFAIDYLEMPFTPPFETEQGHLRVDAIITRCGVLRYYDPIEKEWVNVLRHPDDVFNVDSLASFGGLPLTLDHPIKNGFAIAVTPENWNEYGVGVVGDEIISANPYVKVHGLNIQSIDAKEALVEGNKQLSPGYFCQYVSDSGTFDGIRYTKRQIGVASKNDNLQIIRGNHLALMSPGRNGRSGENVKVLGLDSTEFPLFESVKYDFSTDSNKIFDMKPKGQPNTGKVMKTISVELKKGVVTNYTVDADIVTVPVGEMEYLVMQLQDLANYLARIYLAASAMTGDEITTVDATIASITAAKTDIETISAEKKALEVQISKLQADSVDVDKLRKEVEAEIKNRFELEHTVKSLTGDSVDSTKSDRDLKVAVIEKWSAGLVTDQSSDIEVDTLYKAAIRFLKDEKKTEANGKTTLKLALSTDSEKPKGSASLPAHRNRNFYKKLNA